MPDHSLTLLWSLSVSIKDFGALLGSLGVKHLADSYGRFGNIVALLVDTVSENAGLYQSSVAFPQAELHPHRQLSLSCWGVSDVGLQDLQIL